MTETIRKYTYEPPTITYNSKLIHPVTAVPKRSGSTRPSQLDSKRQRDIVVRLIQFIKSL